MRPLFLLALLAAPLPASVVRPGPVRLPAELRAVVVPPKPDATELRLTDATEVWLDGKRVKLAAVPDGCEITELAVNAANEVVVIKFKTPKGK